MIATDPNIHWRQRHMPEYTNSHQYMPVSNSSLKYSLTDIQFLKYGYKVLFTS